MRQRASKIGKDGKPVISEERFLQQIIKAAQLTSWKVAHFRPAMTRRGKWVTAGQGDAKGYPDLTLIHPAKGRLIFAELKTETGKISDAQHFWIDALRTVQEKNLTVRVCILRPSDFADFSKELQR